jgi:hypothetical protein
MTRVPISKTNPFSSNAMIQPLLKKENSDGPHYLAKRQKVNIPSKKLQTKKKESTNEFTFKNQCKEDAL